MHGYLIHEVNRTRLDELHTRAAEVRRAGRAADVAPRKESRHRMLTTLREALG